MAQDPLFAEMLKRAAAEHPDALVHTPRLRLPSSAGPSPISPKMALILGSLADSASTASFLSKGYKEGNPALQIFNRKPWTVAPMAAGGAVGYALLHKLLSKKYPKLADTIAGGLGAYHGALAGSNMDLKSGNNSYQAAVEKLQPRTK